MISFSRLNENLNAKCQEEQALNTKLLDLERKNIVLATQSQEVRNPSIEFMIHNSSLFFQAQRKYELELDNRRTFERNLEETQRSLEQERQTKNQMGATNREWMEKIVNLERQVNPSRLPSLPSFSSSLG